MIISDDFFDQLHIQLQKGLPFVAYRKPESKPSRHQAEPRVKAFLQSDSQLYQVDDYTESGFVFAPFDQEESAILIPLEKSTCIETVLNSSSENSDSSKDIAVEAEAAKNSHIELVEKGIATIRSGKLQKVVLSRQEIFDFADSLEDAVKLFHKLLATYSSAFVYIWFHPEIGLWLGATPEALLEVERSRFKTMALAGTQKYQGTEDVTWGEKEKVEQQLVTDSVLNDLEQLQSMDKIEHSEPYTTRAGSLLHLRTDIQGVLKVNVENALKKLIFTLHPTPAICGLPKEAAKDFILKNEAYHRSYYSGFLGELNVPVTHHRSSNRNNRENQAYASIVKTTRLFVNLRCMQLVGNKAVLYIGGGITKDSNAEKEWEETQNKAQTMKAVLVK
ncbi:chorismate-binding protein [Gillisia sp. M10.2A]|uniref:Chorismate-binding protein n=1 Tax=Gillisia lutea TaxID=2909668 RepID=A0ABS9EME5_9FLAO|nr:chorismate-binding protein [Gillisia lutea]MCF4102616.1 chorismate-binding protein [Gillisia lutea]